MISVCMYSFKKTLKFDVYCAHLLDAMWYLGAHTHCIMVKLAYPQDNNDKYPDPVIIDTKHVFISPITSKYCKPFISLST